MGVGTGLFFVAVGAILDFAVTVSTRAVDLHTVGLILIIVGALGVVISLLLSAGVLGPRATSRPAGDRERVRASQAGAEPYRPAEGGRYRGDQPTATPYGAAERASYGGGSYRREPFLDEPAEPDPYERGHYEPEPYDPTAETRRGPGGR